MQLTRFRTIFPVLLWIGVSGHVHSRHTSGNISTQPSTFLMRREEPSHSDESVWGLRSCPCYMHGMSSENMEVMDVEHTVTFDIHGVPSTYPQNLGGFCEVWDDGRHPKCTGPESERPGWCKLKWCLVDPCTCKGVGNPPKKSTYLPIDKNARTPLYYSYSTCREADRWSDMHNQKACPKQRDEASCNAIVREDGTGPKCHWMPEGLCEHRELTEACKDPLPTKGAAWVPTARGGAALVALLPLVLSVSA